jgi:hypothetical protein
MILIMTPFSSNVALTTPPVAGPAWTLIFSAAATVTCNVHNRTPDSDVLVRLNGSAGLATDPLDAAAEALHPLATVALSLVSGDLVFARLANTNPALNISGRVTVRV